MTPDRVTELTKYSRVTPRWRDFPSLIYIAFAILNSSRNGKSFVHIPRRFGRKNVKRWLESKGYDCEYSYTFGEGSIMAISWRRLLGET